MDAMFWLTASKSEIALTIIISFIFTMILYGTFPLVFASVRKKPITKRRFALICIVATVAIWLTWQAVKSGTGEKIGNSGPAFLWGTFFYEVAKRKLSRRGILCDAVPSKKEKAAKPEETEYAVDPSFVQTEIPFFDQEKQKETQTEETRVYSPLDPPEKHKKRYAPLWLTICLSVICVALAVVVFTLSGQISEKNTEIKTLTTMIDKLESKVDELNKQDSGLFNNTSIDFDAIRKKADELYGTREEGFSERVKQRELEDAYLRSLLK